jgi:hypothetical protein
MSPGWVSRSRFPRVLDAISKMRRAPRRVLWETEYAILRASLAGRRAKHISAMIRVKDEEEFLYPVVKSIGAHVDEIVIVDNLSSDRTPAIITALRREYPGKVIPHEYPYRLLRRGSENRELAGRPEARSSPHLSATYYNWCLRRCRGPFVLKWDGDMIATDRFEEALKEWRASTKLVMRFKGANVHPDRQHLVAARSSDLEALASGMAVPFLPTWIASMSHAAVEPRLFPKRFARYRMGRWTQNLKSPCLHARGGPESWHEVSEPCFLHLKFCKRAPYSDYSPDVERVVSSNVALGPALTPEWRRTLRRWGLGPRGSDPQT